MRAYLSTPILKSTLETAGHRVRQIDLNINFYEEWLSAQRLSDFGQTLEDRLEKIHLKDKLSVHDYYDYLRTFTGMTHCRYGAAQIDEAKEIFAVRQTILQLL